MEKLTFWKKCSSCKKEIQFKSAYFVCSVSSCQGDRTGYVFCSVPCFEAHIPTARHRQAGAIEKNAPSTAQADSKPEGANRIIVRPQGVSSTPAAKDHPKEVLIIASRLKEYIDAKAGFNTSAGVMDVLSDYVRIITDRAIDEARSDGRKTVLDRDFEFLKNLYKSM